MEFRLFGSAGHAACLVFAVGAASCMLVSDAIGDDAVGVVRHEVAGDAADIALPFVPFGDATPNAFVSAALAEGGEDSSNVLHHVSRDGRVTGLLLLDGTWTTGDGSDAPAATNGDSFASCFLRPAIPSNCSSTAASRRRRAPCRRYIPD